MKEYDNINADGIETGAALRQQLLSSRAGNPTGYEHFRENAGYMVAYTAHILSQLRQKQEVYKEINHNRVNPKLARQIEAFQSINSAFASLENDVDSIQEDRFDNILRGLKNFQAQFFGKNNRQEPLYNSLAFYNAGFAEGIDKDTFIETVSDMDDTLGMGFTEAAYELDESIRDAADALEKKTADQKLTAAEQKLGAFIKTLEEIQNDYREMPEVIEKMNGLCGNLFSKWQTRLMP